MRRLPKKRAQQRLRRQAARRSKSVERERRRNQRAKFPAIRMLTNGADEQFAHAIRKAVDQIVLTHRRHFDKKLLKQLWAVRRNGTWGDLSLDDTLLTVHCFQDAVHSELPESTKARYFPFCCFSARPTRRGQLTVRCNALRSVRTPGGIAYHSPRQPKITAGEASYTVAFFRHAIDRVLDRAIYDRNTYAGYSDAFAILHDCIYFEPCELPDGQAAIVVYDRCCRGFFSYQYVLAMIDEPDESVDYYYRLGYCPLVLEGELAIAKTMLVPGMKGTPEWDRTLRRQARTFEQQKLLRHRVEKMTYRELAKSQDFELFKQFHLAGIPQVVTFPGREVFVYD